MSTSYQLDYRTIDEMKSPSYKGLDDRFGILALTEEKRRAFVSNPFLKHWNVYCQQVAHADGVAFGCEIQFPILYKTPLGKQVALCGSTTFVAKEYRNTEVGMEFGSYAKKKSPGFCTAGSAMSRLMVRVLKYKKQLIIEMPRYILLFDSAPVLGMYISGWFQKLVSKVVDSIADVYYGLIKAIVGLRLRRFCVCEVRCNDEQTLRAVADLIANDPHDWAEIHDADWLQWVMSNAFPANANPMRLFVVKARGEIVAFYMIKKRFHEQASHRGFKNVWLGSIMEWQATPDYTKYMSWILLQAAIAMRKEVDACELITADDGVGKLFRRFGARHVGDGNFNFHIPNDHALSEFREESKDSANWRLRPAISDAPFN